MRFLSALVLVGALASAACSDVTTLEPVPSTSSALIPGTGNPDADAALQTFNNQVVACSLAGNLEYERASHIALMTSVLRFSPSASGNKTFAVIGAIENQISHAEQRGEISPACVAQLNGTLASIKGML